LLVSPGKDPVSTLRLERLALDRTRSNGSGYDEGWIQRLIHANPDVLPIDELEPDLVPAIPICLELQTPAGFSTTSSSRPGVASCSPSASSGEIPKRGAR
jgi:hypothetical protein